MNAEPPNIVVHAGRPTAPDVTCPSPTPARAVRSDASGPTCSGGTTSAAFRAAPPAPSAAPPTPASGGPALPMTAATWNPPNQIVRDLRPRARVLAVASGKGGVGKTNLAVNIAIDLSAAGRRVLLLDADIGLANVDLILGQRPTGHLGHVLAGRLTPQAAVHEGPAGIRWVPGASNPAMRPVPETERRAAVLNALSALEQDHDFLILDLPAGIGSGVIPLACQADDLVLVTTPEAPAVMDAYALLKAMAATGRQASGPVRLVVNMVTHRREAARVHRRLSATAERFLGIDIDLLGHVFCDGHVGRAVQKQQPLALAYPHSQAAWCIKRVASALLDGSESLPGRGCGFLRRLANLFGTTGR